MKLIFVMFAALLLCACAETDIYERGSDGCYHRIARIQGDAVNVTIRTPRSYFHAASINHSTPTLAGGQAAGKVLAGATGLASTVVPHASVWPAVGQKASEIISAHMSQ